MNKLLSKEARPEQLDLLLEQNMGLVVRLAKSFSPKDDFELDEFIQLGRIGAWKAIQKYDPSRAALSTIIWHYVRWEILRHLKSNNNSNLQLDDTLPIEDTSIISGDFWEIVPDYLTDKEHDVIQLRIEGHSFADIGRILGYSRGWANTTFKKAIEKIGYANQKN